MIKSLNQSVGYICPECEEFILDDIDIFTFYDKEKSNGYDKSFLCKDKTCNTVSSGVVAKKDKYKIIVHCPYCREYHEFFIKKSAFWTKDILAFRCQISNMNVFYVGDREKISQMEKEQEDFLKNFNNELELTTKAECLVYIFEELHEMMEEEKIFCHCGSSEIEIELSEEGILVCCSTCGCENVIEPTKEEYEKLVEKDVFILKK